MPRTTLNFDLETYSEINLKIVGGSRYARHPSTEVTLWAYAFDDGPVRSWDALSQVGPASGYPSKRDWRAAFLDAMPRDLSDALDDPSVLKRGWNAGFFERLILTHVLGIEIPLKEWRDTMILAMTCSFPGKLETATVCAGIPVDSQKLSTGRALIATFTQPREPTKMKPWSRTLPHHEPDRWRDFIAYNTQDVIAERAFFQAFKEFDLPRFEQELWQVDQEINDAGLPMNMRYVRAAMKLLAGVTRERMDVMKTITGVDNPNSVAQLLPWLQDRGYPFLDLKKGHVARAYEDISEQSGSSSYVDLLDVLERRLEVASASVKKYAAINVAVDDDDQLRYTLQFAGAGRTHRWSGRRFQPQNLARPPKHLEKKIPELAKDIETMSLEQFETKYKGAVMTALSAGVRPTVQAPKGYKLIDADLNAIENRVLGWMAKDKKILRVFAQGLDPYLAFACEMFGIEYPQALAEYKGGDGSKRTISKPAVLGCGYMLSAGAQRENAVTGEIEATGLLGYAWAMGVKLTPDQAQKSVEVWRRAHNAAVDYWYRISDAMTDTITSGKPHDHLDVGFEMKGDFCLCVLPNGRTLKYFKPSIRRMMKPWGKYGDTITYMGLDLRKQWMRLPTHPGKITENIDQAISRDLIATAVMRARNEGLDVRLHVHDQIIALSREEDAEKELKLLVACMEEPMPWAPDLPLKSAGHISQVFLKD